MSRNRDALEVAAFLDSPEARALEGVDPKDVRRITLDFLEICRDELGKLPHLVDGQDVHAALGHAMPGRLKRKDPLAPHVPGIIEAYMKHLETVRMVSHSFEVKLAIESTTEEFLETVRTGENVHHHAPRKQEPFRHKAPKLGRNDPCSCGSGKKYKKCHGKPG
jgi:hypothetical protein